MPRNRTWKHTASDMRKTVVVGSHADTRLQRDPAWSEEKTDDRRGDAPDPKGTNR